MITRETDADAAAKQDQGSNARSDEKTATNSKASSSSAAASSSSSWSRLKDPRIVRVSKTFGGKDRHSKVCTVRGLRDRRVRLSVPSAIQLYDLQDRLGLNQPSKVVDWLLNATKHEINELPPLQMPPGGTCFNHNNNIQSAAVLGAASHHHHQFQLSKEVAAGGLRIGTTSINWDGGHRTEPPGANTWHSEAVFRPKSKEVARGDSSQDKESWMKNEEIGNKQPSHFETSSISPPCGSYFSSNNFFSRLVHQSSSPTLGLLNSSMPPYNSLVKWNPSNLSLSQSGGLTSQHHEDFHNFGLVPLPPPSSGPQVLLYHQPPGGGGAAAAAPATHSYFPSHIAAEYGSGGGNRPFHLPGTTANLLPSQNDDGQDKHDDDNGFHYR